MFDAIVTTGPLLIALHKLSARKSYPKLSWFPHELEDRMKEGLFLEGMVPPAKEILVT